MVIGRFISEDSANQGLNTASTLGGGVGAWATGGDFCQGAQIGAMGYLFNHMGTKMVSWGKQRFDDIVRKFKFNAEAGVSLGTISGSVGADGAKMSGEVIPNISAGVSVQVVSKAANPNLTVTLGLKRAGISLIFEQNIQNSRLVGFGLGLGGGIGLPIGVTSY